MNHTDNTDNVAAPIVAAFDRAGFLARAGNLARELLTIDGFGAVYVRELTAAEAREYAKRQQAKDADELAVAAWLIVRAVVDGDGRPLFSDTDADQVKAIPVKVISAINQKVGELCGWKAAAGKPAAAAAA